MNGLRLGRALTVLISAIAFALLAPIVAADSVYHTEHLALMPIGDAPLRSGFVQNIKAQGPTIYAHELYVLNGAIPKETYTVSNDFYTGDAGCDGDPFSTVTAVMTTGAGGNARADVFFVPADAEGFEGVHGVRWTVRNSAGTLVYQTRCTAVTLD